jgi:light-regulated signal transduction histidine kinase (bacteriophytochrome)
MVNIVNETIASRRELLETIQQYMPLEDIREAAEQVGGDPLEEGIHLLGQRLMEARRQLQFTQHLLESTRGDYERTVEEVKDYAAQAVADHQLRNKLEHENRELEQFTYIASHDLQEPLRSITSMVQILADQYQGRLDADADNYLVFIQQSASRMSQLIKGLLDYARIGKLRSKEQTDSNQMVEFAVADLRSAIEDSGATIEASVLPVLCAHPMELKLLFQNLLSNAIKFRKPSTPPIIRITSVRVPKGWQFTVSDNGIGIDERYREKIFEIFQRLHNKKTYEGTGIGLAHCKKIVALHNGEIWVTSIPGVGSQFHFTLSA